MALDAPNHGTNDVAGGKQIKSGSTGERTANACMMVSTSNLGEIETAMCKCTKFDKSSSQSYRLFLGLLREQPPLGTLVLFFPTLLALDVGLGGFSQNKKEFSQLTLNASQSCLYF